ncbi:hypothetical protein BDZ94DRAFT_1260849 [Collybia nuda]|uniref:Actin cytoskeleton-regulatory complex protein SLA1 n=1 Tax=Collybia nuda TaxID=64659 RepID=A0A9P5Y5I8_9AGAR|nr:hypothetical protein BDZ94DRAFT_1260849 [Collybia nuda]
MAIDSTDEYLAVLKASYDYQPQSDDEIAIKEGQFLLLKERVDEDWWKVKIKGDSQEEDSPVGLVPAAYVEQAEHTSTVKVLYDYEAAAPGELTVAEDEILLVFDTEQDWLLVQSRKDDEKAGYVPGNYVETYTESKDSTVVPIVVPPSAPRPVSTYVDPADRVASTKVTSDGIKTWSVSEIDKKGKKKKGTLGIGNGAVFFASESDKTPVQKWQTSDVGNIASEKAKHVTIDVGGTTPITLHFHVGSKDNVEAILTKLVSSKAISNSPSTQGDSGIPSTRSPSPDVSSPREVKKVQVHFSPTSPVIIPPREDEDDEDEEDDEDDDVNVGSTQGGQHKVKGTIINGHSQVAIYHENDKTTGFALYDFAADGDDELSIVEGERLTILERDGDEWWKCRNIKGKEGVVPASYIEVTYATTAPSRPPATSQEVEEDSEGLAAEAAAQRAETERIEREQEAERTEKARKKSEAQKRAKDAAASAEAERKRRKEAAAARISPPPVSETKKKLAENDRLPSSDRVSAEHNRPPPERTRVWHDRSGQFRVEAAFLGFNNGKLRLHKVNGVIVEVPSEKMSVEDMQFVERLTSKKSRPAPTKQVSDDDIPLGLSRPSSSSGLTSVRTAPKKKSNIDWFDFFLSAGCDLDDCTRYAASFERDKIDETILPDITDGTMRSLGLREGDIIRVTKAIENRKPTDNMKKPSSFTQDQLRRDEELARQLQAQETGGSRNSAPNIFTGPGGVLKNPRRGRPQPSKSLPPSNVDLKAISTVSDQILQTSSPRVESPVNGPPPSASVQPPPRSSSVIPPSGFDDDAWTNRPNSTKPLVGTPPTATPRAPSAPPVAVAVSDPPAPPAPQSAPTTAVLPPVQSNTPLAKTTESDVFDQLSRLSELRKQSTPSQQPPPSSSPSVTPTVSYYTGLGMGSSSTPISQHIQNPNLNIPTQPSSQSYNGPRGPFAPVPANQTLLQPLIPTQTGFSSFVPARTGVVASPFQGQSPQPSFMAHQPPGGPVLQPTVSQVTGMPFGGIQSPTYQNPGPLQPQFTAFNYNQSPFNTAISPSSVPPLPTSNHSNNTSPANVFAQMKSGTFAADQNGSQPSDKYDGVRPNVLATQVTGWTQPYQGSYMGYQH